MKNIIPILIVFFFSSITLAQSQYSYVGLGIVKVEEGYESIPGIDFTELYKQQVNGIRTKVFWNDLRYIEVQVPISEQKGFVMYDYDLVEKTLNMYVVSDVKNARTNLTKAISIKDMLPENILHDDLEAELNKITKLFNQYNNAAYIIDSTNISVADNLEVTKYTKVDTTDARIVEYIYGNMDTPKLADFVQEIDSRNIIVPVKSYRKDKFVSVESGIIEHEESIELPEIFRLNEKLFETVSIKEMLWLLRS